MQEIVLTTAVYWTSGGCNACVPYETTVYKVKLNGLEIPLNELVVSNLVNVVAAKNGYQQEFVTEMLDEYTLFRGENQTIKFDEEYGVVTYSNGTDSITTKDQLNQREDVFAKAAEILTQIFHLEEMRFVVEPSQK